MLYTLQIYTLSGWLYVVNPMAEMVVSTSETGVKQQFSKRKWVFQGTHRVTHPDGTHYQFRIVQLPSEPK
jgi:hypothetical protein